jgi:hypothetical protein
MNFLAHPASTPTTSPASSPAATGDLAEQLGNLTVSDPIQVADAESEPVSGPSETHLLGSGYPAVTENLLDSKVVTDDKTSAAPEANPKVTPSTSTPGATRVGRRQYPGSLKVQASSLRLLRKGRSSTARAPSTTRENVESTPSSATYRTRQDSQSPSKLSYSSRTRLPPQVLALRPERSSQPPQVVAKGIMTMKPLARSPTTQRPSRTKTP